MIVTSVIPLRMYTYFGDYDFKWVALKLTHAGKMHLHVMDTVMVVVQTTMHSMPSSNDTTQKGIYLPTNNLEMYL